MPEKLGVFQTPKTNFGYTVKLWYVEQTIGIPCNVNVPGQTVTP